MLNTLKSQREAVPMTTNTPNPRMNRTPTLIGLLLLLSACNKESALTWKEEVRLLNGHVIVVSRRSEFNAPREIGQAAGESYMWMDFEHPITKETVHYESKLRGTSGEMVAAGTKAVSDPGLMHRPYALMMKGDDLYAVIWLDHIIGKFFGCPDPPFLLYRWHEHRWERRPLEEIPQRKFTPNLSLDPSSRREEIASGNYRLKPEQIVHGARGQGELEYDFQGMTRQTFDLPPNCATCTVMVSLGPGANSKDAGPFCTRDQRDWSAQRHLSN